jgi:hypothetical protein
MPLQGKPAKAERPHKRPDDQRVLPHAVNLAEQQEPDSPSDRRAAASASGSMFKSRSVTAKPATAPHPRAPVRGIRMTTKRGRR